jgi:hypothetical protein
MRGNKGNPSVKEEHRPSPATAETSSFLFHQWVVAGLIAAAARFVPIPFVDDAIRGQCRRFVVSRTLASHHSDLAVEELKPYYNPSGGWLAGWGAAVMKAPLKLVLFPIRKVVAMVTSIRTVPMEVLQVVLLGRTLDRYLHKGKIPHPSGATAVIAARLGMAFREAFVRMDFHLVRAAVSDALRGVSGWRPAATANAEQLVTNTAESSGELKPATQVDTGAARVQEVLSRPEMLELFSQFDRRVDEAFERLA